MQTPPARRKITVFVLFAVLLALVLGYVQYRDTSTAADTSQPAVNVAPAAAESPAADTTAVAGGASTVAQGPASAAGQRLRAETVRRKTVSPAEPTEELTVEEASAPEPKPEPAGPPRCDQLVLRDGDLIDVHVLEVGLTEIRYKRCGRRDGPDYVTLKRDVLSIRYPNGDVDRF